MGMTRFEFIKDRIFSTSFGEVVKDGNLWVEFDGDDHWLWAGHLRVKKIKVTIREYGGDVMEPEERMNAALRIKMGEVAYQQYMDSPHKSLFEWVLHGDELCDCKK